jgi:hypothetical protein
MTNPVDPKQIEGLFNNIINANLSLIMESNHDYHQMLLDTNPQVDLPDSLRHLRNAMMDLKSRLDTATYQVTLWQTAAEELSEQLLKEENNK